MTIYQICKQKLEQFPSFRERRFRGAKLAQLACRDLGLETKVLGGMPWTFEELDSFAKKADSYRHEYDAVQKEHKHLQGSDYPDGKTLAEAKQIEFGYEPGFRGNVKKLSTVNA